MISWELLTVGDLIRYQEAFDEKGIIHEFDGDMKVVRAFYPPR